MIDGEGSIVIAVITQVPLFDFHLFAAHPVPFVYGGGEAVRGLRSIRRHSNDVRVCASDQSRSVRALAVGTLRRSHRRRVDPTLKYRLALVTAEVR